MSLYCVAMYQAMDQNPPSPTQIFMLLLASTLSWGQPSPSTVFAVRESGLGWLAV